MPNPFLDRISVAPHFFNYYEYFKDFDKFFKKWMDKQVSQIEKYYGEECIRRIKKNEIPLDENFEKKMRKTLKGKELKAWKEKELECFLAFIEFNDLEVKRKTFYSSFLIYIFADFENTLDNICNQHSLRSNQKIKLKDIAGRGIERSINYLSKVAMFKLPNEKLQREIILMRDIRNCIAHAGGRVKDPLLLKRLSKSDYLEVLIEEYSEEKTIYFDDQYCKHALKILSNFTIELAKKNNKFLWHWELGIKQFI